MLLISDLKSCMEPFPACLKARRDKPSIGDKTGRMLLELILWCRSYWKEALACQKKDCVVSHKCQCSHCNCEAIVHVCANVSVLFLSLCEYIRLMKGLKKRQRKSGLRRREKSGGRKEKKNQTCSKTVSNQILAQTQEELMLWRLTLD